MSGASNCFNYLLVKSFVELEVIRLTLHEVVQEGPPLVFLRLQLLLVGDVEADDLASHLRLLTSLNRRLGGAIVGIHYEIVPHVDVLYIVQENGEGREGFCHFD